MKHYLEDALYCLKLSLYFFAGSFIVGSIVGLILHGFSFREVIVWGCRLTEIIGTIGLVLSGVSFVKRDLMRPLNYQRQWDTYFKKFNLSHVIFLIAIFIISYSFIIEYFIGPARSV
ncbi:hypothetical protein JK636_11110 [Clostridium sp. YIM B02515]|uniref:Uncharacterized protein n=1 Tax=Clostridium rhizosphaerae TaxID=2803861 RepID=A0ABS1TAC9_9CLOT|nr:hypothetical protein [Clostridium rhizosphaerae]MBL4936309.1 hypothetical protein [Clostridium rhizosphaerae]